jgi:hypothetical protein
MISNVGEIKRKCITKQRNVYMCLVCKELYIFSKKISYFPVKIVI